MSVFLLILLHINDIDMSLSRQISKPLVSFKSRGFLNIILQYIQKTPWGHFYTYIDPESNPIRKHIYMSLYVPSVVFGSCTFVFRFSSDLPRPLHPSSMRVEGEGLLDPSVAPEAPAGCRPVLWMNRLPKECLRCQSHKIP